MIDFTQKGTKLPIIPIGTEYKVQDGGICNKICNNIDFVSFGMFDDIWLKCESSNYISKTNHYLIKLSTIERLAKEQGMCDEPKKGMVIISPITTTGITKDKKYIITEVCDSGAFHFLDDDGDKRYSELTKSGTINGNDWIISNTNNEQIKTQVALNAYGGVVVTENNTTTIHSKETALQIYEVVLKSKGLGTVEYKGDGYYNINFPEVNEAAEQPETISIQEAEKQLGKVITD